MKLLKLTLMKIACRAEWQARSGSRLGWAGNAHGKEQPTLSAKGEAALARPRAVACLSQRRPEMVGLLLLSHCVEKSWQVSENLPALIATAP
jgi:hypothetical protein